MVNIDITHRQPEELLAKVLSQLDLASCVSVGCSYLTEHLQSTGVDTAKFIAVEVGLRNKTTEVVWIFTEQKAANQFIAMLKNEIVLVTGFVR